MFDNQRTSPCERGRQGIHVLVFRDGFGKLTLGRMKLHPLNRYVFDLMFLACCSLLTMNAYHECCGRTAN